MAGRPLSQLDDWELVDEEQDLRGRPLLDQQGHPIGTIAELLVNTKTGYVDAIELEGGAVYAAAEFELQGGSAVLTDRTDRRGREGVPPAPGAVEGGATPSPSRQPSPAAVRRPGLLPPLEDERFVVREVETGAAGTGAGSARRAWREWIVELPISEGQPATAVPLAAPAAPGEEGQGADHRGAGRPTTPQGSVVDPAGEGRGGVAGAPEAPEWPPRVAQVAINRQLAVVRATIKRTITGAIALIPRVVRRGPGPRRTPNHATGPNVGARLPTNAANGGTEAALDVSGTGEVAVAASGPASSVRESLARPWLRDGRRAGARVLGVLGVLGGLLGAITAAAMARQYARRRHGH